LESQFSKIQVLVDLGLSRVQAKVFLTLVEFGPLTATEISEISKIARSDIYPKLSKLENLCLVEKIIETPVGYRAIPMDKAVSLLLKTKTEQYQKIRAESKILLHEVNQRKKAENTKHIESQHFILIPKGTTVVDRINTAIENAQHNIDLVISWKRFSRGIITTFTESIEKAWKKPVKMRFIVEKPLNNQTAKQLVHFCRKRPSCQMKFIPNHPETVFGIYDKKEVFVIVFSKTDLPGSPALWSDNSSLIALTCNYFELLWREAIESTP